MEHINTQADPRELWPELDELDEHTALTEFGADFDDGEAFHIGDAGDSEAFFGGDLIHAEDIFG